jgi:quercetin dioxygenase-like cupin family protein
MMTTSQTGGGFVIWHSVAPVEMVPGMVRRTLAYTDRLMSVEMQAEAGVTIAEHSHPHDQVGYVVSGLIELTIAGHKQVCDAGDSYAIPGGLEHGAHFPSACTVLESFSPARDEFRRDS